MADYKEGVVESIKIATLEKQIEILEKLGLSKDEILEKMSNENADILTIILNKIDSLYEQEEQKLVEQLARTLLANQSEASVKYVLEHKLIGKVLKHILESDNDSFDGKTIVEILEQQDLVASLRTDDRLWDILMFNTVIHPMIVTSKAATVNVYSSYEDRRYIYVIFQQSEKYREKMLRHEHFRKALYDMSLIGGRFNTSEKRANRLLLVGGDVTKDVKLSYAKTFNSSGYGGTFYELKPESVGPNMKHVEFYDYRYDVTRLVYEITLDDTDRYRHIRYIDFS